MDFRKYHQIEDYLFKDVSAKFRNKGYIDEFDFICILKWKSNRSKLKNFDKVADIKDLTKSIYNTKGEKEKLGILIGKKFRLPTATAILSVLYPQKYTIYDIRVREQIKMKAFYSTNIDKIWPLYEEYMKKVISKTNKTGLTSFRERDRFLWGKSFYDELKKDLKEDFKRLRK